MRLRNILLAAALASAAVLGSAAAQTVELGFALHTSPPGPEFAAVDKFIELVRSRSQG